MLTRWRCGKSLATRHLLDRWTRRHQEAFVHTSPHRASALPWDWLQGRRKLAEHTVNKYIVFLFTAVVHLGLTGSTLIVLVRLVQISHVSNG